MEHILDNFIFNAAITGNRHLSIGSELVKYFPKDLAPFVGLKNLDEAAFAELGQVFPAQLSAVLITGDNPVIPTAWNLVHYSILYQLVATRPVAPDDIRPDFPGMRPLGTGDIPQMIALTKLTNPGPFLERTIEFGNYMGIFEGDRLLSMAGNRFHAGDYVEVSAVCTHPDALGRGYASALLSFLINQLFDTGKIPYLHVRPENTGAISVYERLGFTKRADMHLNVIRHQNFPEKK